MATPYRGYSEIPGPVVPDVPYRVNLSLREVDADVEDLDNKTAQADTVLAGRVALLESAAGVGGPVLGLQDQVVTALINAAAPATTRPALKAATGVDAAFHQSNPASPLAKATAALIREDHSTPWGTGPLAAWGAALLGQLTKAAVWVSLGSSTANGGNTSTESRAWHHRLSARLGPNPSIRLDAARARPDTGVQTYSGAVGGTSSANYLSAALVAKINTLRPDLVTHMVGSNDWAGGVTPAAYKANMRGWLTGMFVSTPDTVHVLIHQQARWDTAGGVNKWAAYGVALKELAAEFPDKVLFFNVDQVFAPMGFPSADYYSIMTGDKMHMNDQGHAILADVIGDYLGAPAPRYVPREVYRATTFAGGASLTGSAVISTITIPPKPYMREAVAHAAVYGSSVSGGAPDVAISAPLSEGNAGISCRLNTTGTYPLTKAMVIPAHTEVAVRLIAPATGNVISTSSNAGYMSFHVELNPAY